MPRLLLVNGPNLGRLGQRLPQIYGHRTLAHIVEEIGTLVSSYRWTFAHMQSNHEGEIIDFIDEHRASEALIINPGALMMNGWSLHDALEDFTGESFEVHLTNVWRREQFRHYSVLSSVVSGVIAGLGTRGYVLAAHALMNKEGLHDAATNCL